MAKPIVHIGLTISTDGFLPSKSNIVNIAAFTGTHSFNQNVLPQYGAYVPSVFWKKHPEVWEGFKRDHVTYQEAFKRFLVWIKNFQGSLVACTSTMEFWHLFQAMMEVNSECPFGSAPLEVSTYLAALQGLKAPKRFKDIVTPPELAQARWQAVTEGKISYLQAGTPIIKKSPQWRPANNGLGGIEPVNVQLNAHQQRILHDMQVINADPPMWDDPIR